MLTAGTFADGTIEKPEHVECAFAAYDAIGRPRTLKVVNTSRENGEICMTRGESIGQGFGKIKAALDERFHWIWHEDLDQQVETAKATLHDKLQVL